MSLVEILWPPFALALLLVFIHTIFGLEIIKRGVIFTDLAIGQSAAVGMAVSLALFDSSYQAIISLLFALLTALSIAFATKKVKYIEAFIGLLYALGISSVMIILSLSGKGLEVFNKLNASDILFTTPFDIFKVSILYLAVSILILFVYPKLKGIAKETLFFSTLAVTVTSSVQYAGVLVVFVLLIAPAFIALSQQYIKPLLFAWLFGTICLLLSLTIAYFFDLPAGYTIVAITALLSIIFTIIKKQ